MKTQSPVERRAVPLRLLLLALAAMAGSSLLTACSHAAPGNAMASVNGHFITRDQVDRYYRNQVAGSPQQPSGEQAESLRLSILQTLIEQELMLEQAQKLGLLATDEEVNTKFTEFKAPYTQDQFEEKIKERGLTDDDFRGDLRRQLTIDKVLNREVSSKIDVSDTEIKDYYQEHTAEFNLLEPQYHLAQIVVTSIPNIQVNNLRHDKVQNDEQARKKIAMLTNRLQSGDDFATLAMNYSEQPDTASNGGDLGFVSEQNLRQDPSAYTAIARLAPGQATGALPLLDSPSSRRTIGYVIYKLIAREPRGQRELSDPRVQQAIRQELRDRKEQLLRAAYSDVLKDQAKVENYFAADLLKRFQK